MKTGFFAAIAAFLAFLFCTTALAIRDDVLVIVNDNSIDSPKVGAYYAEKRGINPNNIVHVRAPSGYSMTWDQFRSLRDQIIKHMQERTLDASAGAPAMCNIAAEGAYSDTKYYCSQSIGQLKNYSKIRYLVTTKGLPVAISKVPDSQLSSPTQYTSVDNYLRFWLVNYFTQDVAFSSLLRSASFGDGRGMRSVIPSQDKELIIGRAALVMG